MLLLLSHLTHVALGVFGVVADVRSCNTDRGDTRGSAALGCRLLLEKLLECAFVVRRQASVLIREGLELWASGTAIAPLRPGVRMVSTVVAPFKLSDEQVAFTWLLV